MAQPLAERYAVLRPLGAGGMGSVSLAQDTWRPGVQVALKSAPLSDAGATAALEREFAVLRRLRHPGVVAAGEFGACPAQRRAFFTMEIGGARDASSLPQGQDLARIVSMAASVADALSFVHARGFVHGDVKAANLLVREEADEGGQAAKLVDFGLALRIGEPGPAAFAGTITHAAPEWIAGAAADPRADLYALGVTLFALVAGRLPFEGSDAVALAEAHRTAPPPSLRSLREVPEALDALVARLLAKEPARRPASAAAVAAELRAIVPGAALQSLESRLAWARAPGLEGCEAALAAGEAAVAAAADPSRPEDRVLSVRAGEGRGKTRLLGELADAAQLARVAVLRGSPRDEPWSLFARALRDAQRLAGTDAREAPAALAWVDPALCAPGVLPPAGLSADDARDAVGRAAWDLLASAAARPVVLLLDDADEADEESRWLLAFLARQVRLSGARGRVLPLGVVATSDAALGLEGAREVALPALAAADADRMVRAMFPACEDADALARLLLEGVGPRPRLVELWCAELVREGALRPTAEGWTLDGRHPACARPPRDLVAGLRGAIASLPAARRALLLDLALLPRAVELCDLEALRGESLSASVEALEREGFASASVRSDGRPVAIASRAVQDAVLAAAGDALARDRAGLLLEHPRLLALGDAGRATLAERAGRAPLACDLLERALEHAAGSEDHPRTAHLAERLAALSDGARRRQAWRRGAEASLALERVDAAAELVERAGREAEAAGAPQGERAEQAAAEGMVELRRGRAAQACERFACALALEPDAPAAVSARWRLERARAASAAGLPEAGALIGELADRAGEDAAGLRALVLRGAHELRAQRTDDAVMTLERGAALARRLGAELQEASCENNLGVAALRRGDRDAAAEHLQRAVDLRLAHGARGAAAGALMNLVLLELDRGRAPAALKRARQALAAQEDVGSLRGMLLAWINIGVAHVLREDWAQAEAALERAISLEPQAGDPGERRVRLTASSELARALGRAEEAAALAREAIALARSEGAHAPLRSALAIAAALGDADARAELEAAVAHSGSEPAGSLAAGSDGAARLALAEVALDTSTWTRIDETSAALPRETAALPRETAALPRETAALARATVHAAAALEWAQREAAHEMLPARLVVALAAARAGDVRGAERALAEVTAPEERAGRPSARAMLAAARAWCAARSGDLRAAERHLERGLEIARGQARRVPRAAREGFLAQPPWQGLRAALVAARRRRLDAQRDGAFFAVLEDAPRPGAGEEQDVPRAAREARRRAGRLLEILEITRGINAFLPVREVLLSALSSAMRFMDADRGFIVLREDDALDFAVARDRAGRDVPRAEFAISRSVLDEVVRTKETVLSADARADERFAGGRSVLALDLRSVLVAPLVAGENVLGAIYLDNARSAGAFDENDRQLLALLAMQAAVAVANAKLHGALVEKERLENELAIARAIQQGLLPRALPEGAAWRVAAAMDPAREIGGDYYDFIDAGAGRLRIAVGDVSGKGVPAGLTMVMARTILRSLAAADAPLVRVLEQANEALAGLVDDDRFMTMLLLEPAPDGRSVRACIAGHEPPLAWRRGGRVEGLAESGLALAMLPDVRGRLEEQVVEMAPGELIACYTDGITECRSPAGEMFGRARLEAALAASGAGGAQAALDGVLSAVERFRGDAERHDDLTLVIVEARG